MHGARPSSFIIRGRHTWRSYDGNGIAAGTPTKPHHTMKTLLKKDYVLPCVLQTSEVLLESDLLGGSIRDSLQVLIYVDVLKRFYILVVLPILKEVQKVLTTFDGQSRKILCQG